MVQFTLFGLLLFVFGIYGHTWTKVNPTPTSASLSSVVYGDGKYVIVGETELIPVAIISSDLVNWQQIFIGDAMENFGNAYIAYLEGVGFAVVDYLANPMFSPDLINWSSTTNAFFDFNNLVAHNGKFLSCSASTLSVFISTDGMTWNNITVPFLPSGVGIGEGDFLSVGYEDNYYPVIYRSEDAVTWELAYNISEIFPDIQIYTINGITAGSGDDIFIWVYSSSADLLLHSATEDKWIAINVTIAPEWITYNDGVLIVFNGYENYMSTDYGKSFQLIPNVTGYPYFQNDMWFSVGQYGTIQISSDAQSWTTHDEGLVATPYSFFYSELLNSFVLNTNDGIYVSTTGETWDLVSNFAIQSLAFSTDLNMFYGFYTNLSISSDLVHWKFLGTTDDCSVNSYAYASGTWVLTCNRRIHFITEGYIYTSTDNGMNFVQTFSPETTMDGVVSDGTTFVATDGINIYASSDGKNWNAVFQATGGSCWLSYVGESPFGKFFFYGDQQLFVSFDGLHWESAEINFYVASVSYVYVNEKVMFMASGYNGLISTSMDGILWLQIAPILGQETFVYFASFGTSFPWVAISSDTTVCVSVD